MFRMKLLSFEPFLYKWVLNQEKKAYTLTVLSRFTLR